MFIYKDPNPNNSFVVLLRDKYQIIFENGYGVMQVNRGKVHKYLGMTLDYTTVGKVKITML